METARILIVDDEPDILELLRYNLEREGWLVESAETGEDALRMVRSRPFDLVVLDLMLPGIDGLEVCARIKAGDIGPAVLMLTARTEDPDIVTGLNVGADDYVTKPFSPKVLTARIKALLRRTLGEHQPPAKLYTAHGIQLDSARYEVMVDGSPVELSATEFGILEVLIKNPGWVFSRAKIIDAVKGDNYPVTERSVDVQILGLRRKLGQRGEAIQTVRGVGYRLQDIK
ncbi:response regulator transcription factor [Spirochaeta africana]|uniref:Response regulator with CheY-like receiver domain and winged-helix DNA-binding domain n=1 Tax=Spirochaeta africana (strain ATCC 700263 / DSM 8902 / Z-7692) TaxID=889378 RepID=H9UGV1_SPIAZ|nr:response regulator transcription factor [Spirochaeta africana]AFG36744.1 response regulator with CheY-like receiver domain and winged-helix DNA-binding domain [Spirochaeta africana DSM 8902]